MSPTFRALSNPNYRLYAAGAVVSNVGTWMQRVAQDWLVLQLTDNNGTALGITTGLQFLPILLLSPYAGLVADRFPKRRLLQVTQLMMAAPALLLGLLAVTGLVETWHVYALAFVFGVGTAFDAPARQSFVSEIVDREDLSNAVGLNSASFNLARIVGPALAGFMIAWLGGGAEATGWVIGINAVSYAAVVLALQRMRAEDLDTPEPQGREKGMIRDGLRYIRSRQDSPRFSMMKMRPVSNRPIGSAGSLGRRESRNQRTSIGAPKSSTDNPARDRTTECRPSAPTTKSARTSSGPSGVWACRPTICPPASIRSVTSAHMQIWNVGYRVPSSTRKFRKSHCGMKATKRHWVGKLEKSATVKTSPPNCALMRGTF